MALGLMLPGMVAGWIEEHTGYPLFFTWVCFCTLPGILAAWMVYKQIEPDYEKKQNHE